VEYQWLIGLGVTVGLALVGYIRAHLAKEHKSKEKLHERIDDVEGSTKEVKDRLYEHLIRHEERERK